MAHRSQMEANHDSKGKSCCLRTARIVVVLPRGSVSPRNVSSGVDRSDPAARTRRLCGWLSVMVTADRERRLATSSLDHGRDDVQRRLLGVVEFLLAAEMGV